MGKTELMFTGSDTEGGITSGYQMNDGVKLKVPYSFFGSIFDEIFPLFAEQRGM